MFRGNTGRQPLQIKRFQNSGGETGLCFGCSYRITERKKVKKKTIITVVGNDTVGIIAKVCTYLADNNVNILDISQTIVQGYFNMMMVADTSKSEKDAAALSKELSEIGDTIGVVIRCQHEDIFNVMHRI